MAEEEKQPKTFDKERLKGFITQLALASVRVDKKRQAKREVSEHIGRIKKLALNKRSTKGEIESQMDILQDNIAKIIRDESKILDEQRADTALIREMKKKIDVMNNRLIDMGKEYAANLEEKDVKIDELEAELGSSKSELEDAGYHIDRKKRLAAVETRLKAKIQANKQEIKTYEEYIKKLEGRYKKIKAKGKHKKEDLQRVKKVIDTHKAKIKDLKKRHK